MHPILFTIPGIGVPIYSFGAMIAVAFFLGSLYLERLAKRSGDDPEKYANLSLWLLLGVVGGGRLLYVIVHPSEFTQENGEALNGFRVIGRVLAIWTGGLVFYGGFIAAFLIGMWKIGAYRLDRWHAADLGMIAGFLGLGIGRIGCYLVGDDHGRPCPEWLPFPFALTVPDPLPDHSYFDPSLVGQRIYGTQFFMMLNGFGLAAIGRWILARRAFPGQVTFTIVGIYAVSRGVIEYFRGDDFARGFTDVVLLGHEVRLYTSVKIGAALLPLSIVMYLWLRARHRRSRPAAAPASAGATGE